jgi:GLPGLI family protein
MKKLILTAVIFLPVLLAAQMKQGMIQYQETIKLEIDFSEDQQELAKMFPSSQSFSRVLYFNEKASLYKDPDVADETGEQSWTSSQGNATVKMVIKRPEDLLFKSFADNQKVEQKDFMGKKFLIQDEQASFQWKVMGDQMIILGYPCIKAVHEDTSNTIVAWFTSQIPVSTGPDKYGQLPGLILSVDINEGERVIQAQSIDLETDVSDKLEAPTKGKKVSQAEFEAIREEKKREMEEAGNGNSVIIKIRN